MYLPFAISAMGPSAGAKTVKTNHGSDRLPSSSLWKHQPLLPHEAPELALHSKAAISMWLMYRWVFLKVFLLNSTNATRDSNFSHQRATVRQSGSSLIECLS